MASAPDLLVEGKQAPFYDPILQSTDIACFIHVLRESDGSGGLSDAVIDSMWAVVVDDFEGINVYLTAIGQEDLANSSYYSDPDFYASSLFSEEAHTYTIDIYLGPSSGDAIGRADGIPGSALVLTGLLDSYSALSHLLGNCLGLYSTDESVAFGLENPNGSDGETTGDLISDTAADPGLMGLVLGNCLLSPEFDNAHPGYDPDPENIMSNSLMSCLSSFTEEQGRRVLTAVETYGILQDVVLTIPGPSVYLDYSDQTELDDLMGDIPIRSNVVAFDFFGTGSSKADIILSGHASTDTLNNGHAYKCSGFNASGVPQFEELSHTVFFGDPPPHGTFGMLMADYDNDGDLDLYTPNIRWHEQDGDGYRHRMYRNEGNGTFLNVTATVFDAVEAEMGSMHGSWGDYDGDGFLDLLAGINNQRLGLYGNKYISELKLYHNEQIAGGSSTDRCFVDVTEDVGVTVEALGRRSFSWVDFDQDHDMDFVVFAHRAFPDSSVVSEYYLNEGGVFTDATDSLFTDRCNLEEGHAYLAPGDFDNDGDIDIIYHGHVFRGYFKNNLIETGVASLSEGWHVNENVHYRRPWVIRPTGLKVFDFDLDGWLDFGMSNSSVGLYRHRIFHNDSQGSEFMDYQLGVSSRGRNLCAVDWNKDGFTELVLANEKIGSSANTNFFFRNGNAISRTNTNHWVGISLRAEAEACNVFGIGATVIITAGAHTQAQVIDGGSGNAGQNPMDLSFGLGSYSGSVDVEVIWPCGQTQYATVQPDTYSTLGLGLPAITDNTTRGYLEWVPAQPHVTWVFEWETTHPSEMDLDQVEFPDGVSTPEGMVYIIEDSDPHVGYSVNMTAAGNYQHLMKWTIRPCDQILRVPFTVHSYAQGHEYIQSSFLRVINCPQMP